MQTQALFQWEDTIVPLCNYIWVSYRATYRDVAREEGSEGLGYCLPYHLAHLLSSHQLHCPCSSSSLSSVIFPCCSALANQWHPSVPAGLTLDTSGQPFISGLLVNGSPAPPRPHGASHVQILPRFCGKGPEQPLQDPMGSCHAGHLASTDLSLHPQGSLSLLCAPCKSSLSLKSCREPYTSLHKLRVGKRPQWNHKTQITFRKKYPLMVQPCELIVGFTEHRWSSRALLQSAQAAGLPLSPALWASSRHTVLKGKEKFLMQVGRWY